MGFAQPSADLRPIGDLNTTPLIDVMLVLLVMFIVTMPPQSHKVAIALPGQGPPKHVILDPVRNEVTIDARDRIAWNGEIIDRTALRARLRGSMRLPLEPALDLIPAAEARYELVDGVIADIKHAGVTKLGVPGNEAYRDF